MSTLTTEEQQELVLAHASMVRRIAKSIPIQIPGVLEYEDAVGFGMCGLVEAARRFDPNQGNSFRAYATRRVRGAIFDAFRRMDRLSRSMRQQARDANRTHGELQSLLGRAPTDSEAAGRLGVSAHAYRQAIDHGRWTTVSLDEAVATDSRDPSDTITRLDQVAADDAPLGGEMEHEELIASLAQAVRQLPDRERAVIGLYYVDGLTMREIALVLGVSETRVSQVHAQALFHLRQALGSGAAA